ncbi:hypothetical protein FKM82_027087 [Ascaphus truei]
MPSVSSPLLSYLNLIPPSTLLVFSCYRVGRFLADFLFSLYHMPSRSHPLTPYPNSYSCLRPHIFNSSLLWLGPAPLYSCGGHTYSQKHPRPYMPY